MEEIKLTDTVRDVIKKMADGNPGAVIVLHGILKEGSKIDQYCQPIMHVLALDDLGIRGDRIWILYKDRCGSWLVDVLTVLRAHQYGILTREQVISFVDTGSPILDFQSLKIRLREKLPEFGKRKGEV